MTWLLVGCVHRDESTGVADPAHGNCIEGLRISDGTVLRFSARDSKMLLQTAVSVSPESIEVAFSTEINMRDISARLSSCRSLSSRQS